MDSRISNLLGDSMVSRCPAELFLERMGEVRQAFKAQIKVDGGWLLMFGFYEVLSLI